MMDKVFDYLKDCGVAVITTNKGILIPSEDCSKIDVATISGLLPDEYRCCELPKQYRDDVCGSVFIGLQVKRDTQKMLDTAKAKLLGLGK